MPHTSGIDTDDYALLAAQEIQSHFPTAILLAAKQSRNRCDQNRPWCRFWPMRNELRPYLQPGNFVLDVHSFDAGTEEWERYRLVILDTRGPSLASLSLSKFLRTRLNVKRIPVYTASWVNDIQVEAHEKGAESFLIEFNEGDSADTRQLLARLIADWLKREGWRKPASDWKPIEF